MVSPAILTSIKPKNHLFKLSKSSLISRSYYNRYRNRLTALIRHSKRIYFKSTFDKYKTNIKKTWSCIKDIICTNSKKSLLMSLRDKDRNLIPKSLIPDTFNNYFSSVASNFISSLTSPVNDFKSYLNTPCPN